MKWLKANDQSKMVNLDDLSLSFNQSLGLYAFLAPGDPTSYVTRIDKHGLGYGNRYILLRVLNQLKQEFENHEVPAYAITVQPIPHMEEAIVRRLGKRYLCPIKHQNTIEKKIDDQRNQFMSTAPDYDAITGGNEDSIKNINMPSENFQVSHA